MRACDFSSSKKLQVEIDKIVRELHEYGSETFSNVIHVFRIQKIKMKKNSKDQ